MRREDKDACASYASLLAFPRGCAVLVAVCMLGGFACITTKTLQRPDLLPPEQGIVQARAITESFAGKEVEIELAAARPVPPNAPTTVRDGKLQALDGATYLFYERDQQPERLPFAATRRISHNNRALGSVLGFGIGATIGALVGMSLGSGFGCDGRSECEFNAEGARQVGVFGGLVVGGVGALIGAALGYRIRITF